MKINVDKSFAKILFLFYRVKLKDPIHQLNGKTIWKFEFHPKKVNIVIFTTIILPFVIAYEGLKFIKEIKNFYLTALRIEKHITYQLQLPEGETPTKLMCYEKF